MGWVLLLAASALVLASASVKVSSKAMIGWVVWVINFISHDLWVVFGLCLWRDYRGIDDKRQWCLTLKNHGRHMNRSRGQEAVR